MINTIHIFGASGSGTTTLAGAVDEAFGHTHLDTDDYFWIPTDPPYITKRTPYERRELLKADIAKNEKCVISGSLCGWGDIFIPLFDLVIFIDTPTDIRIKRIEEREYKTWGNRILADGDMYDKHTAFIEWAKTYDTGGIDQRSRILHIRWIEKVLCPVLTIDGRLSIPRIIEELNKILHK